MTAYWDKTNNFGDALAPWLIEKITGQKPQHGKSSPDGFVHVTCGSVLNVPVEKAVVWGAGFARCLDEVHRPLKVCAVRGPRTREKLIANGIECPEIYGDPALLLPRFLLPSVTKKYRLGIIPHYVDYSAALQCAGGFVGDVVIDLMAPVEEVVGLITQCETTLSSSLHGLICSHAYGIPSDWVKFSDKVEGCGFKFHDYLASVGLPLVNPVDMVSKSGTRSPVFRKPASIDLEKLWEACPFRPA